jgi:hypothetical protein
VLTGARVSQLACVTIGDLQEDRVAPRVLVPTSKKGTREERLRRPVPIPPAFATGCGSLPRSLRRAQPATMLTLERKSFLIHKQ